MFRYTGGQTVRQGFYWNADKWDVTLVERQKLQRLPYFVEGYEPDGMKREDFNKQAAVVATAAEFSKATRATVDFIAQQVQILGKG